MVAKFCSKSHGQPVFGVRSAAMISISRAISREGVMKAFQVMAESYQTPRRAANGAGRLLTNTAPSVLIPKGHCTDSI